MKSIKSSKFLISPDIPKFFSLEIYVDYKRDSLPVPSLGCCVRIKIFTTALCVPKRDLLSPSLLSDAGFTVNFHSAVSFFMVYTDLWQCASEIDIT